MSQVNAENQQGDRRNINVVRTVVAGVVAPLIVGLILGYVALNTTITKVTVIAEQNEKRLVALEQGARKGEERSHELQILMTKQNQILEMLHREMTEVKEDHKQWVKERRGG